jgi:hypothetical protein
MALGARIMHGRPAPVSPSASRRPASVFLSSAVELRKISAVGDLSGRKLAGRRLLAGLLCIRVPHRWAEAGPPDDLVNLVLAAVFTAAGILISSFFTYLASTKNKRSDVGQQMIDQHQEDIAEMRGQIKALQQQARIQCDYIRQLRRHIYDAQPVWALT